MNLPVFCKVLGDVTLQEVDVGSTVLDTVNFCVAENEPPFTLDMSGVAMYQQYKTLSPSTRLGLEDLELLSKNEWTTLSKQCEMLVIGLNYNTQSSEMYLKGIYVFGLVVCMLVSISVGIGYVTNLTMRGDSPDSYLIGIVYELVDAYKSDNPQ